MWGVPWQFRWGNWVFRFYRHSVAGGVCILAILLGLGSWQLARGYAKAQLIADYDRTQQKATTPFDPAQMYPAWTPVVIQGHYDPHRTWLLGQQFYQHQPGYRVFSLFYPDHHPIAMWVDRGFWTHAGIYHIPARTPGHAPGSGAEASWKTALPPPPAGTQQISGWIHVLPRPFVLHQQPAHPDFPAVVDILDRDIWQPYVPAPLYPQLLILKPTSPGILTPLPPPRERISPERHWGYAFQWFMMAAIFGGMWIAAHRVEPAKAPDDPDPSRGGI